MSDFPRVHVPTFRERLRRLGMEEWYDAQPLPVKLAKRGQAGSMVTITVLDGSNMPRIAALPLAWSVN